MARPTAIKPKVRHLVLWGVAAAAIVAWLQPVSMTSEGSTPAPEPDPATVFAGAGAGPAGEAVRMVMLPSGLSVPVLAGAPAVLPGLAPRMPRLPMKTVAPPLALLRPAGLAVPVGRRIGGPPKETVKPVDGPTRLLIHQAARRHGIEPAMLLAIIMAESGFDPKAVSRKGAKGLMQLMPGTAAALGVTDIFDPGDNIEAGARYFRKLLNRFRGDVELALAAYNAGSRNVRAHRGIPPFEATRRYVRKVLTYYEQYKRLLTG